MYAITPQHGSGAGRDPDPGQGVGVHFVLLDQPLTLLMYVYTAVLAVVDLIVPHYRITVCANLKHHYF